jgi:hypothetical protein
MKTGALRRLSLATAAVCALALLANVVQARAEIRPGKSALEPAAGPGSFASPAGARLHTRCAAGPIQLVVRAVPAFRGVRFSLDRRAFESDASGVARIEAPGCGMYQLDVAPPLRLEPGVRTRFARWADEAFTPRRTVELTRDTTLEVGFEVDYLVQQTFVDLAGHPVDPARVSRIVQSNSLGSKERFAPGGPRWLVGSRVMRRSDGLQRTEILYSVREVRMNGTNVVRQAAQRFYPSRTRLLRIQLLLYSARISASDRFFGFPIGSSLELVYPDGTRAQHRLDSNSTILLESLPRGTYDVTVKAPGMSPTVPIALTRNQVVELKIVSYLDLGLLFGSLGLGAVGLLLLRRPRLRACLCSPLAWAQKAALGLYSQLVDPSPHPLPAAAGKRRSRRYRAPAGSRKLAGALAAVPGLVRASAARLRPRPLRLGALVHSSARWLSRAAAVRKRPRLRVVTMAKHLQAGQPLWSAAASAESNSAAAGELLALSADVLDAVFDELMAEAQVPAAATLAEGAMLTVVSDYRERPAAAPGVLRLASERPRVSRALVEQMLVAAASRRAAASSGESVNSLVGSAFKWSHSGGLLARSRTRLERRLRRRLDRLAFAALVLEGIELAGEPYVAALGVTRSGETAPIGLWDGSASNGVEAAALLLDLVDRGLDTSEGLLVVIDGSEALRRSVRRVFGRRLSVAPPALEGSNDVAA